MHNFVNVHKGGENVHRLCSLLMHISAGSGTVIFLLMQICIAYAASYAQFGQCIFQLENLFLTSLAVEDTPQWQNSLQSFKNTIFPTKQSKNYKLIQNRQL